MKWLAMAAVIVAAILPIVGASASTPYETAAHGSDRGMMKSNTPGEEVPGAAQTYPSGGDLAWRVEPGLNVARKNAAGAVVNNAFYVIAGGEYYPQTFVTTTEMFDGTSWTIKAPIPIRHIYSRAAAIGNRIYVPGGYTDAAPWILRSLQIYDTTTDTWSLGAQLPYPLYGSAVAAYNNKLYVLAGSGYYSSRMTYEYDPATNSWAERAPMPVDYLPAVDVAGVEYGGEIYVLGGFDTAVAYAYSPGSNTWRTLAPLPQRACSHGGAFVLNGEIWLVGCGGPYAPSEALVYNPASDTWRVGTQYGLSHAQSSAVGVYNGRGFVAGGGASPGTTAVESLGPCDGVCPTPTNTPTATAVLSPTATQPVATSTATVTSSPTPRPGRRPR